MTRLPHQLLHASTNELISELMPLKYRHIGLGIADAMGFVTVVAGPIAGRTALVNGGDTWRWLYWVDVILIFVTLALMTWLYHVSLTTYIEVSYPY
jgi:hypothetical protein